MSDVPSANTEDMSPQPDAPLSGWRRVGYIGGWIGAFLFPAWIAFSRVLVGTAGSLSLVFAVTLALLLLILALFTLLVPRRRGVYPSSRALVWLWISFFFATVLGFFLPDELGGIDSVVAVLFGEAFEGSASAISNPAAIVMSLTGVFAAVMSTLDSRPGGPVRTADEDDYQGQGHFPLLGED